MNLITFYLERDGEASARESILMQFEVSLRAILNVQSHASAREYRARFVDDAIAMCEFLGHDVALATMQAVLEKVSDKVAKMAPADAARATLFVTQFREALAAVVENGAQARAALYALQDRYPLDTPKSRNTQKHLLVDHSDLERAMQLLSAENIPFSLS